MWLIDLPNLRTLRSEFGWSFCDPRLITIGNLPSLTDVKLVNAFKMAYNVRLYGLQCIDILSRRL